MKHFIRMMKRVPRFLAHVGKDLFKGSLVTLVVGI